MQLLLITNLYPPQELGGYGRAMADFAWGLMARGHHIQVLGSNAPYLGADAPGPNDEQVARCLQLKGSFQKGIVMLDDAKACSSIDQHNQAVINEWLDRTEWDGILLGNLDLLGREILEPILTRALPILHHIGFVAPPFPGNQWPKHRHYQAVAASKAVRQALVEAGIPLSTAPVVYPGARTDLFGNAAVPRPLPPEPDGSQTRPLRVCFAGLQMSSKGPHTLLEALCHLKQRGIAVEAMLAGGPFQKDYANQLRQFCTIQQLENHVQFLPQLSRSQLARYFRLNHAFVFPSLHPEAFGIVAAEAMASGLALVSTGVGGASEIFEDEVSGLSFPAGDSMKLSLQLERLANDPALLKRLQNAGQQRVRDKFSVSCAAEQLEHLFQLK